MHEPRFLPADWADWIDWGIVVHIHCEKMVIIVTIITARVCTIISIVIVIVIAIGTAIVICTIIITTYSQLHTQTIGFYIYFTLQDDAAPIPG